MADHLTAWGELGQAEEKLDETRQSRSHRGMAPVTIEDLIRRWRIHALENDWVQARQHAFDMMHLDDPRAAGMGTLHLARGYLFEGRSHVAGALAEEAAFRFAQNHQDAADAISTAVEVRLGRDDAVGALELIREARAGGASPLDRRVAFWEPIALARIGRWAEADRARNRLGERLHQIPGPSGQRLARRLDGELSLQRGAARQAVSSLTEAARLLPPRGFCGDHVPIWYALARAHLTSGDAGQAEAWLEKAAGASWERLCWPIPYARTLALLGRIRAAAGRPDQAAEVYERYLALWGDGDLDAADRDEARQFLLAQTTDPGATVSNGRELRTPSVP
jgi:tetratricopeptide (TPR) repeat protein